MAGKKWIQGAVKHPGALHRALDVKAGEAIPVKKLAQALKSKDPHVRHMAQFARTMRHINHGGS
jgi:hypothetical protein